MAESITMFGAHGCDDTERTRAWLVAHHIPFHEISIDEHPEAAAFVTTANAGYRSTPTLLIGSGKQKLLLTEPTDDELARLLVPMGDGTGRAAPAPSGGSPG